MTSLLYFFQNKRNWYHVLIHLSKVFNNTSDELFKDLKNLSRQRSIELFMDAWERFSRLHRHSVFQLLVSTQFLEIRSYSLHPFGNFLRKETCRLLSIPLWLRNISHSSCAIHPSTNSSNSCARLFHFHFLLCLSWAWASSTAQSRHALDITHLISDPCQWTFYQVKVSLTWADDLFCCTFVIVWHYWLDRKCFVKYGLKEALKCIEVNTVVIINHASRTVTYIVRKPDTI
jgi:hypothetical protein